MSEMIQTSKAICKSCKYSVSLSSFDNGLGVMCDYLNKKKEMRNCDIGECDKYEPKKRRKK